MSRALDGQQGAFPSGLWGHGLVARLPKDCVRPVAGGHCGGTVDGGEVVSISFHATETS